MSNNKQSSIEFILNNIHLKDSLKWPEIIEQAKAMHKEEIINAWRKGDGVYDKVSKQMSVQYYNQTFGGNNEQQ